MRYLLRLWHKAKLFLSRRAILKAIEARVFDLFLETLLDLMKLYTLVDRRFREENVEGFEGRYVIHSRKGNIAASAVFAGGRMHVERTAVRDPDVAVVFEDGQVLHELLASENKDIFAAVLDGKIVYEGNLNYLLKFMYMAKHIQLALSF